MMAEAKHHKTCNASSVPLKLLERNIINSFVYIVCIFGIVGNGAVIWLLGFRMKRTPFTTYILNLAIADFGTLISLNLIALGETFCYNFRIILPWSNSYFGDRDVFTLAYSTSQFLLMAISIDRCVAVLFPFWYRCHRPLHLSSIVCATIWSFCLLLYCLRWILPEGKYHALPLLYVFLVTASVCLPLITISTLILFIRVCFKSQQHQRGKILMVILLTLFVFLILAFPMNAVYIATYSTVNLTDKHLFICRYLLREYGSLCASLNSFANPLIYFLVGRGRRGLCRENLKLILQRVFKEEEEAPGEEQQHSMQTQL